MSETLLPLRDDELRTPVPGQIEGISLMTSLALVEGDILMYLDEHGATTLRHLNRELDWPFRLVLMGIGALMRTKMVRAIQSELEIIVLPDGDRPAAQLKGRRAFGVSALRSESPTLFREPSKRRPHRRLNLREGDRTAYREAVSRMLRSAGLE